MMPSRKNVKEMPVPLESEEQRNLFTWAKLQSGKYPELELMYHIPNGGYRHKREASILVAEGVKTGVPDICLPAARGPHHGLYIELKRQKGGKVSDEQCRWLEGLRAQGYCASVCAGWKAAAAMIVQYLDGKYEGV